MATIEYFYSAHSAFAYLGSARFAAISPGHMVIHRPVDLDRVVPGAGVPGFKKRTPAHRAYYFRREIQRWAQFRGVAIKQGHPQHHYNDITLGNCMVIAGIQAGLDVQPLAHAMLQSHWRDDSDLADPATLLALAKLAGFDGDALLRAAQTPEIQAIYATNTDEAIRRSVFGSPTYFVDGDMFYGQDRLELVERALSQPFTGDWP
jgi:2-hydroxychromene-2-carboxylate isomerase